MITERERQILRWIEENPLISQQELAALGNITRSSVAVHISNMMKKGLIQGKGYILQKNPYIVVIGGINMDIFGRPDVALVQKDSNPGRVSLSAGGVAHNIAYNLTLLGEDVKFISAFGEDAHAISLAEGCRKAGMDITHSLNVAGGMTSTYLYITDEHGDMVLAISDMDIYQQITPKFLETKLDFINRASLCIIDANLSTESLCYLAGNCTCPIFADTVSTAKAKKLSGLLYQIHTLKPNRLEAQLLTGIEIHDQHSLQLAAKKLLNMGLSQVFISLGAQGVFCADHHTQQLLPCYPSKAVNMTGAGDSMMAALAWGWRQGLCIKDAARAGLAAASICVASDQTISTQISADAICQIAGIKLTGFAKP